MTQSMIIFAVILIVKAILTAVAKSQEAKKKAAERESGSNPRQQSARQQPAPEQPLIQALSKQFIAPRKAAEIATFTDARAARASTPHLESASTADMKADARRRAHLGQQTPIKAAPIHESEGESTFEQLARTVAAIQRGVLSHRGSEAHSPLTHVPQTHSPLVQPSGAVKGPIAAVTAAKSRAVRNRFSGRQAMIAFEIFSPPLALRTS